MSWADVQERVREFIEVDLHPYYWHLTVGASVATPVIGLVVVSKVRTWLYDRRLQKKRTKKRDSCRISLNFLVRRVQADKEKPNPAEINRLVGLTLPELADELQQRHLTAKSALRAFQSKAITAHSVTNCLTEAITEAEQWADELDKLDSPRGMLHGVPISIKEYFGIKGYNPSIGLVSFLDKIDEDDSVLVKVLKRQGAIPFVKTNLPHMAFSYTTRNPIFGITLNPHDQKRGPGGSSGGEGALIALNGSPLGFGSDVGGSIRNPCHFCGLAGLKPTSNRISTKGTFTLDYSNNCLPIVLGPMSRDVDGLVLAMRAVLVPYMFQLDRSVPPLPFSDQVFSDTKPLRIGFHMHNGLFQPVPSCQRAVTLAKDILSKRNHKVVLWELPQSIADAASELAIKGKLLFADGGETVLEVLAGDRAFDNIADFEKLAKIPMFLRKILAQLLRILDPEMADYVKYSCGCGGLKKWWGIIEEVHDLRRAYEASWDKAGLDALICPAFSCPALPVDELIPHRGEGSDLQVYNVLDVPAGVVPVTTVTKADLDKMFDYPEHNEAYRAIKQGMVGAEGLPVGVQVVAARWQEELCLRVMKEIETGARAELL